MDFVIRQDGERLHWKAVSKPAIELMMQQYGKTECAAKQADGFALFSLLADNGFTYVMGSDDGAGAEEEQSQSQRERTPSDTQGIALGGERQVCPLSISEYDYCEAACRAG